ncbi:MAG: lytic transglycosylase domain-containing protein [Bacillota bacterium]
MGALRALVAAALLLSPAAARAEPLDQWTSEIAGASARFGIPEAWIRRVIRVESGGRALFRGRPVVSSAGAMGLMQLMPATWSDMRALLGLGADPQDPHDNILAGTAYLRRLYDRFGYPGLFAAYNAGPARYAAYLSGRAALPAETRAYVAAIAGRGSAQLGPPPSRDGSAPLAPGARHRKSDPANGLWASSRGLFVQLGSARRP